MDMMRILTIVVLFFSLVISFIGALQFIKISFHSLKEKGIFLFVFGLILCIWDYFLTLVLYPSYWIAVFFTKHFWFIILYIIFLKNLLIQGLTQEENWRYYFFIPVTISIFLILFFEIFILFNDRLDESFVKNFIYWASYFGIFGGIFSGLILCCFKSFKNIDLSIESIFIKIFKILFFGVCSLLPTYIILNVFIPKEAIFAAFIVPTFVYIVSFIIFVEMWDYFVKYRIKKHELKK